ncbi:MAG TPA: plastocyanin/azurin family copper-binding protein, partial [Gemmatimonadaceae bacterium]|nr:plastocyanin/azurin family copper-binding protein [Gemmatimonadaceae bacterium]
MNRTIVTVLASVAMAVACNERKSGTTDSAATATSTAATATAQPSTGSSETETAAPISGQTVEVKMLQDAQGSYRFDPADVTIKPGDGVKFIMVSGAPHNVA